MADNANKPQLPPESHYNPKKLDKIFAIIALILLASLLGIFAKDYSKQWKEYQKQFKALELEKTRVKADAQSVELGKNEEYQTLLKELKTAEDELKKKSSQKAMINKQIAAALAVEKLYVQKSQFAKAEYDAVRYQYDHAKSVGEKSHAQKLKEKLDKLTSTINDLRQKIETEQKNIADKTALLNAIGAQAKELEKKRAGIAKKSDILERKLNRIDPEKMSIANQVADVVRDLPLVELANSNYRIKQIVIKDIPEDVNFMKVQRVDRCTTCHLGIDNPDYKNAAQPFRSHPNLDLFIAKNSPHPVEEFACTSCHMGRGRATDFISAAHTPKNEEQRKEWVRKYNWAPIAHWEQPMLPAQFTQAGCFKCHEGQEVVKGAERLNLGLNLIERAGCYGCHDIAKYKKWPKSGPSLEYVASKINERWAYQWIWDPKSIRHNTWMPSYFNQSNNNDPESIKRNQQEVLAIVKYLFKSSKPYKPEAADIAGDEVKGKELVASLGCMACHQVSPEPTKNVRTRDILHSEFGPNLIGLGTKTDVKWLADWLKNPNRYHPETKMPSLRLSDQEAADIASYLVQDKTDLSKKSVPAVDEKIVDAIAFDFIKKRDTLGNARAKIAAMKTDEKLVFIGEKLIREYGCFSCHKITGFENEKPIGPDLTEEGSKSIERLDFGFIHIDHTKNAWLKQKLADPRIFDKGKSLEHLDKNKMPNFHFTDDETDAITTALLGFVKDRPNTNKLASQGVKDTFVNDGQKLIRQFNCQGCHIIEGDGGSVQSSVKDWLIAYQGKDANDAKATMLSYSPPNLVGEGAKVQAQWLFEFLHSPIPIRPWLSIRMPTYNYHGDELNSLIKYFNYLDDQAFPFTDIYHPQMSKEELDAAQTMFSKEVFGCAQCHIVGDQMPSGSPDGWAPNFALAEKRLKPEWIITWLKNPAALLPSTKMPTYFDPNDFDNSGPPDLLGGDEHRQLRALRDYLLTITSNMPPVEVKAEPKKAESPAVEK